jgi:amino acid adenylation domain-containing protein
MLTDAQRDKLAARLRQGRSEIPGGIARRPEGMTDLPLSFGQEQLWFLDRFAPGLATYNIPYALRLLGPLDAAALGRALDGLVARHEALRTRLVTGPGGRPVQVVDPAAGTDLTITDLSAAEPADRDARLSELKAADAAGPFVLAEGPLLRVRLVRLTDTEHILIVVVHHAVFDGWSLGVMLTELMALYPAELTGEPAALEELTVQFADYAIWERERAQGPALAELLDYWQTTLDGFATLQLPTDRPRPRLDSFDGEVEWLNLGGEVLAGLRELAHREGTTLFVTLLAAFQVLLQRYTGQDDIVVGTVSANRGRSRLAPLIGFLVNTLAIRTDVSGDPAFTELLGRVRDATVGAYAHQDVPFGKLVEALRVERDPSRAPVFQVGMTLAEAPEEVRAAGLTVRVEKVDLLAAKFDVNLLAEVRDGELLVEASYSTALFDAATIRRMLGQLGVVLAGVVKDPGRRVSELPILTGAELRRELVEWNDTVTDLPVITIHEGFERQVVRAPGAVAAELDGEVVSYAGLNAEANQVARYLRGLGVGREVMVGVSMTPTPRRLAVLLGIMKVGGAYVPLDPALPADRLSFMISDTAMPVIVADDLSEAGLPVTGVRMVLVEREWPEISALESGDPGYGARPDDLAYVIYTSGSTGRPKGVLVEHRHAVNFLLGMAAPWRVTSRDRVLQFASLNFDVSVMDMFMTLLAGATAVLAPPETLLSPPRLADLIRDAKVTFACLPPAVVALLTGQSFPDLRLLLSAGEELSSELVRKWLRPGLTFYNGYGPTEAAIGAAFCEIDGSVFPPPIGRPKPNYQAYVLDPHLNPVPVGVAGELHVGGAGVTRGYLNAPDLTARRFIDDPFGDGRLYKTGDLVRRMPDGNLVFLGRIDGQVKIRGLRVELGEIETALVAHPAVAQAVVIVAQDGAGEKQLAGYVRYDPAGPATTVPDLRQHLAERVPAYMVPTYLLVVEAFPLTANGKIDKAGLPAPDTAAESAAYVAPRTLIETVLADMYAQLLGRDEIGIDDGFFDLGGNSLQAMQLINTIDGELAADIDVDVATIFLAPTPRQLTVLLCDKHGLKDVDLSEEETAALSNAAE